jgi:hypothetical protein
MNIVNLSSIREHSDLPETLTEKVCELRENTKGTLSLNSLDLGRYPKPDFARVVVHVHSHSN